MRVWMSDVTMRLPDKVQSAAIINKAIDRPPGWFENHAGIRERRIWQDQDPLKEAARAGRDCLVQAELETEEIGALIVTSEAPPMLAGLGAALHHQLDLHPDTVVLELGG